MKTIFAFLLSLATLAGFAQNNYEKAMTGGLEKLGASSSVEDFQNAANIFERISVTETNEWLPLYYAAHCYVIMSFQTADNAQKDKVLDKAQAFVDKAMKLVPQESELYALQAFIYPSRITVDPMNRGAQYLGLMNQAIEKAISLNPENPRAYYLKAEITMNLPEGFGGGAAIAKPIFETAKAKFDSFKPVSPLHPNWGKEQIEAEMAKFK